MSQILRNLLNRSSLFNRVLTHEININFQQNHLTKLATNKSNLINITKYYVSSTFPITNSAYPNTKNRGFDELDEFSRPNRPRYENRGSGGGVGGFYNKRPGGNFNKSKPRSASRQFDNEDFEGSEQVESSGKASDYGNAGASDFSQFNLPPQLIERMNELGYTKPFEIQEATLKYTLEGKDLVGKAFTGSGKTLAFAIPIITKILNNPNKDSRYPKCLVLSPTRELCLQLTKSIQELAPQLKCLAIYGGTNYESQVGPLKRKVDVVCATPGRLRDLIQRKEFVTDDIEIICLDEADELLRPNFMDQIEEVIQISNKKQMLMFSATINKNVAGLVRQYMDDPVMIDLTKGQKYKLPVNIQHHYAETNPNKVSDLIPHYLKQFEMDKCIIFTNTKRDAMQYNYMLNKKGLTSSDLHSDISQTKRQRILEDFRRDRLQVLVATDVAARGLDIPEINLVINVGFPPSGIDYYIHRSGRTGRAGRVGNSILIDDGTSNVDSEIFKIIKFNKLAVPDSIKNTTGDDADEAADAFNDQEKYINRPRYANKYNNNDRMSNSYSNRNNFRDTRHNFGNDNGYKRKPYNKFNDDE